jgi:AAA+ superfamily predicted ATPase
LIGEIYQDLGILKKGHLVEVKASDLVADFVGGTAIKTNDVIDQAIDGVLFIDEAYALSEKDRGGFGAEALETIFTRMENDRNHLVVILAGYREQISRLVRSNPGIDRRFPKDNRFEFPDLDLAQLVEVLQRQLFDKQLTADEKMQDLLKSIVKQISHRRGLRSGNAGEVRNLVESLERKCLSRLAKTNPRPPYPLHQDDIPEEYRDVITRKVPSSDDLFAELNDLIGIEPVKNWLTRQVARIQYEQLRNQTKGAISDQFLVQHLIFVGNPGTGKTTVARMIGEIYHKLGLLRSGHLVEVSMPDLIAGYVGQTTGKVMEQVENAIGGVLFIDEAYALVRNNSLFQGSFGHEVVDTLVKAIEDYRGQLLVIMAGYPNEMEVLLRSNPGLRSRFAPPIPFPDFDEQQMQQILEAMVKKDGFKLTDEVRDAAIQQVLFTRSQDPSGFGNAREIRSTYERMKDNLAYRVLKMAEAAQINSEIPPEWEEFTIDDVSGVDVAVIIEGDNPASTHEQSGLISWVINRSQQSR